LSNVGLAGGFTLGGGHSPLATKFGLAADQVLEWEVITAKGELLTVTPTQNPDLFWALYGGGRTYGIAVSMTARFYSSLPATAAKLSFANHAPKMVLMAFEKR
jgi:FAD/FMN-containing dehydrogenase